MPYFSDNDLPDSVKRNLPKKAREIYRKVFNHYWDQHRDRSSLPSNVSRVAFAAKIACRIKQEYVKGKSKWIKKRQICNLEDSEIIDISWPVKPGITEYENRQNLTV